MITNILVIPPRPQPGQQVCIIVSATSPVTGISVGGLGGTPNNLTVTNTAPGQYEACFTWPPGGTGGINMMNAFVTEAGQTIRRTIIGA